MNRPAPFHGIGTARRQRLASGLLAAFALGAAVSCSPAAESADEATSTVTVNVGYQSKTINTVTAGTLLRERGTLEKKLAGTGKKGVTYKVVWHDFPSGPPMTAQMIAGKVDIGSMGDYPILVNGSKTAEFPDAQTELVAVTGYNMRGSLNQVVVPPDSSARDLGDLKGKVVSTSVGSAAHGMFVNAVSKNGMKPDDVKLLNQDPSVGASALESGQVAALSQFVPWPQLMVFRGKGRLLYDGGSNGVPTFHAVVSRKKFAVANPEVMKAFLASLKETSDYLNKEPLAAAQTVAKATGIEPEVVYLYNGPNGLVTFDPTIKPELVAALEADLPFLMELGSVKGLDLGEFVNDSYLRDAFGAGYDAAQGSKTNPNALKGEDKLCAAPVDDPLAASEVWWQGAESTAVASTPECLLRQISADKRPVRAAYVPDTKSGVRLFAATASWVSDPGKPAKARLLPFAVPAEAEAHVAQNPGAKQLDYSAALAAAASER